MMNKRESVKRFNKVLEKQRQKNKIDDNKRTMHRCFEIVERIAKKKGYKEAEFFADRYFKKHKNEAFKEVFATQEFAEIFIEHLSRRGLGVSDVIHNKE